MSPAVESLTLEQTRAMLRLAATRIIDSQDLLTKADQAIGDGDHGVGMARGFRAVLEALEAKPAATVGDLFKTTGLAILMKAGGASGAVFGTFFSGAGKALSGPALDAPGFARALAEGFAAVQARGGAKVGDKTMLDALAPAAAAAQARTAGSLSGAVQAAAVAAAEGAEATKGLVATTGKAKALGERSRGAVDPGALSLRILLAACADYVGQA